MTESVIAIVLFMIAIGLFILSFRSFKEKGFLFNNAYIWASKRERDTMDKKPHYRQSAIVFLLLGIIFLLDAAAIFLKIGWIGYVVSSIAVLTLIYAIVSSIAMEIKKN